MNEFENFISNCKNLNKKLEMAKLYWDRTEETAEDLKALSEKSGRYFSKSLCDFYTHGIEIVSIEDKKKDYIFGSTEFATLEQIESSIWREEDWADDEWRLADIAESPENYDYSDQDIERIKLRLDEMKYGIPIWCDQDYVVVNSKTGVVSRHSSECFPSDKISDTLEEFLEHYLSSGCFKYGGAEKKHFKKYWKKIKDIVPFNIPPKENLWLQHLDRWYKGNITK